MNIDQKDIMKTAASQLRGLSTEVQQFRDEQDKRDMAVQILKKTASPSLVEFLDKIAEYMDEDLEDLKIIDKAVELQKTGEFAWGSLSSQGASDGGLDPLTAMLTEDYL